MILIRKEEDDFQVKWCSSEKLIYQNSAYLSIKKQCKISELLKKPSFLEAEKHFDFQVTG
jgi:hypothetical protein